MAFQKKHENSSTRSIRMPLNLHLFLKENFKKDEKYTANDFIVNLIETSEDYKKYIKKKLSDDNQPSLF